jgi:hypothetical protein
VAGDYVLYSNADTYTPNATITLTGPDEDAVAAPVYEMSVDNANVENYATGMLFDPGTGSASDISFTGGDKFFLSGIDLSVPDLVILNTSAQVYINDCTITFENGGNYFQVAGDGGHLRLNNVTIDYGSTTGNATSGVFWIRTSRVEMFGGSVTGTSVNAVLANQASAEQGGLQLYMEGVDLSAVQDYLIKNFGDNVAHDYMDIQFHRCELASGLTGFSEEAFWSAYQSMLVTNCSGTSSAAEYQYYYLTNGGDVEDATDIKRSESTPYTDSQLKVSLKVATTAYASPGTPLTFVAPARFADLETSTTDHINIYLASTSTLTDADVWVVVTYPKGPTGGTSKHQTYEVSTRASELVDASGTALTDDSGSSTWLNSGDTDLVGYNEYVIKVDTTIGGTVTGLDSAPIIRIYVSKPSVTIYFDTTIELTAS